MGNADGSSTTTTDFSSNRPRLVLAPALGFLGVAWRLEGPGGPGLDGSAWPRLALGPRREPATRQAWPEQHDGALVQLQHNGGGLGPCRTATSRILICTVYSQWLHWRETGSPASMGHWQAWPDKRKPLIKA